jgi:hypothetical protein
LGLHAKLDRSDSNGIYRLDNGKFLSDRHSLCQISIGANQFQCNLSL